MGIKKFFKIKPPPEDTIDQNRENLSIEGITVKNPNAVRKQKFAAYGQFAREKATDKFYAPPGYEDYANPQQSAPEDENGDDLNKVPIDPNSESAGESPKKEHKKKRGLFGRKKSHKEEDEAAQKPVYDPYAVNTDLNAAPYSIVNNANPTNNGGNNTRSSSAPPTDPYASFNNNNSNNRYGASDESSPSGGYSTDPYSQMNRRSQSSRNAYNNNSSGLSRDPSFNNGSTTGHGTSPYGSRGNSQYGGTAPTTTTTTNPYGSRGTSKYGDEVPSTTNQYGSRGNSKYGGEAPTTTNPYSSRGNSQYGGVPPTNTSPYGSGGSSRRDTTAPSNSNPYSGRNGTATNFNRDTAAAVSAPYNGRISATKHPHTNSIPTDLNAISGSRGSSTSKVNPYTSMNATPYGGSTGSNNLNNPYENVNGGNVYSAKNDSSSNSANPYGQTSQGNPYGGLSRAETFNDTQSARYNNEKACVQEFVDSPNDVAVNNDIDLNETLQEYNVDEDGDDLNADLGERMQHEQFAPQQQLQQKSYDPALETSNQDQYGGYYESPRLESKGFKTFDEVQREEEERQQQEEDEAVDELKQEIRFTKQSSVASTRNTLKMAQEAEMAGMNTLGMLGHQSEKLNNVERNLDLIKIQNSLADDKVAELKKLNRNILAVHVTNPFNSKSRQREREEKLKNKKIEEKMMMEYTNKDIEQSTRRIENAMNTNMHGDGGGVREKYQRQKVLDAAKKYQFENDEEDDEMEVEIDRNLSQIQQVSGRLKKLAISAGEEIDAQQQRLDRVENNTDDLDIKINMNTNKLSYIK
ncbi:Meiosis-specific subunit of the t-SNARE complex [Monosporozyma unispora]|nr:Meiosis-specific subunit of the t-SNARE complex [Kazachstania unispora]